ncbi:unnamed protein product [Brachionus calyciflorus]|uniref:phosphatidylinositol-3,5-bisphosphate 3-phosphatase n=1 Tax=Brachionus calyciflorus TaxID=104777 RepID=A0A814JCD7_9BILA|nr:unnamed protein product [Brachionus calyciflorus]
MVTAHKFTCKSDENTSSSYPISPCLFSKNDPSSNLILKEYKRMKFDSKHWRLSEVNKKFELCPSYPDFLIVPKSISDEQLRKVACFRSSKRFPAVTWRSKKNGAVLARSSQPNVGLLAWRLNEDELLLRAIADSCGSKDSPGLLIIDARFRSVAFANRVKGGGYEYTDYYTNCEIQFMNLENIHVIRASFQSLRLLCQTLNDNKQFLSQLENTKWLNHLSGIIKAALAVTNSIDQYAKPVLIHCSDGWDRTPQILALAKIFLDPYYRTINGFRTLIEIDWLQFGHKFAQRNGHCTESNDINERCPVFLQWLDCVYQVLRQYPSAFQFNETFLLKLCVHSYSCLFGTFLCNSNFERVKEHTDERTFSLWSYLNEKNLELVNQLYDESIDEVLYPLSEISHMQIWHRLFCESEITYLIKPDRQAELNCFNDFLEMNILGTSPILEPESLTDNNVLTKLTPDSSVSSTSSNNHQEIKINNLLLLKNAINDTSSALGPSSKKNQSFDNLLNVNMNNSVIIKKRSSEPNLNYLINEVKDEVKVEETSHTTTPMLTSTDTLCDDLNAKLSLLQKEKEDELKIKIESSESDSSSSSSSEGEESSSMASTSSSTIPSPSGMKLNQFNSVSTSTSGLSDYIHSSNSNNKLNQVNRLKSYFNSNYDFIFNNLNDEDEKDCVTDGGECGDVNDSVLSKISNNRASSKSIPILNSRNDRSNEVKRKNGSKCVKDLIDVDGLTKIEDNSFRKIIERDRKNKKEIQMLRDQVNKFKWFLNKLATNSSLHDMSLDLQFTHEFADLTNKTDENYLGQNPNSQCYSFGNDSVCSSWDEINESDYKLTTWVPDYYVTHCQNCSQKFSYRLRKHHCRNCGQVFCYKCADYYSPLPNNNLHEPVRVCLTCKSLIDKQKYNTPTTSTPPTNGVKQGFFLGSSRCNHENGKFKKSDNKSQKVSV